MNARDRVTNPILLSPDEPGFPHFQFVVLDAYEPRGRVTPLAEGVTEHCLPAFSEIVGRFSDRDGQPTGNWWCVTRMPVVGTDFEFLAACIDNAPESLFHVLSGQDYGDSLTGILNREWPDIHSMLETSTAGQLDRRLLLAVDSGQGRQWMVADVVVGEARGRIEPSQVEDLIVTALSVALRTNDWITKLPGILELGPDFATRRRQGIAGVLSGIADVGGALHGLSRGSLDPQAVASAVTAANELPDHIRRVFR